MQLRDIFQSTNNQLTFIKRYIYLKSSLRISDSESFTVLRPRGSVCQRDILSMRKGNDKDSTINSEKGMEKAT